MWNIEVIASVSPALPIRKGRNRRTTPLQRLQRKVLNLWLLHMDEFAVWYIDHPLICVNINLYYPCQYVLSLYYKYTWDCNNNNVTEARHGNIALPQFLISN